MGGGLKVLCLAGCGGVAGTRGGCGSGGGAAITGGYTGGTGETAGTIRADLTPAVLELELVCIAGGRATGALGRAQFGHSPEDDSGAPHLMHLDTLMPPDESPTVPSAKPSVQMKHDRQRHNGRRLRSQLGFPEAYRHGAEPAKRVYLAALESALGSDDESQGGMVHSRRRESLRQRACPFLLVEKEAAHIGR